MSYADPCFELVSMPAWLHEPRGFAQVRRGAVRPFSCSDEFSLGSFAQAGTAACLLVRAHRCGVVLHLPPDRILNRKQLIAAFGLKDKDVPCGSGGQRVGAQRLFSIYAALPAMLEAHGGWARIAAKRTQALEAQRRRSAKTAEAEELHAFRQLKLKRLFFVGLWVST